MATVLFDFDSTLISCESLEAILRQKLSDRTDLIEQLHALTEKGMNGTWSFKDSLLQRLAIAQPSKKEVYSFADQAYKFLTPGMDTLIHDLISRSVQVWIISGALHEVLLPVGTMLGIPESQMCGVRLQWSEQGSFIGIDVNDPFSNSKYLGASTIAPSWQTPRIGVGDGMTDYALYENHLVDHFIAFTQHVHRQSLLDKGVLEAADVPQLRLLLGRLLNDPTLFS